MLRLGAETDALVNASHTVRTIEPGRACIETPSRRDYWFGHGFVLDAPPDARRLDALLGEGRERFRALGAERFTVTWERAFDAFEPLWDYVCPPGVSWERRVVMRFADAPPERDESVADVQGDADWEAAARITAAEYRSFAEFTRWQLERVREDVTSGRARMVAVREAGVPVAICGMYRGASLARFFGPVTAPAARGRGYFSACARTLLAWALEGASREVVIVANDDGPVELYRSLGFDPVAWQHAVVANATARTPSLSERVPC